jgi:hypothetical protein
MTVVGTMTTQQPVIPAEWGYAPCRYQGSRLLFRGPPSPLDGRHVAVLGGSETLGRRIAEPWPALLEGALGVPCANLAQWNGSVEAFLHDTLIPKACADAALTVIALTGAGNVSNRLYSVHPRRNDRFLRASPQLRRLYPEVDFAEICFTRHLLMALRAASEERFEVVREELRTAWLARMRTFLDRIGRDVVILWFAPQLPPSEEPGEEGPLGRDPLFVSRRMVDALRPLVRAVVVAPPAPPGETAEEAQARAAAALVRPLREILPPEVAARVSL